MRHAFPSADHWHWRSPEGVAAPPPLVSWEGNLLRDALPPPASFASPWIVARSGSLAEDPFEDEPRNWMGPGRAALEKICDGLVGPLVAHERLLLLRPHARQVLSDVAGTADFLRRHRGERFGLALAPADLLTIDMLPQAEDHLLRIAETLAGLATVVLLEDARPCRDDPDRVEIVPIGEGVLPLGPLLTLVGSSRATAWIAARGPRGEEVLAPPQARDDPARPRS